MHNNPIFLYHLSGELDKRTRGSLLTRCFSASPTDIYFVFSNDFVLRVQFIADQTLVQTPDFHKLPKRNLLNQFPDFIGAEVLDISTPFPDRCIIMSTSYGHLRIQAFGRNSGVLAVKNENPYAVFKYKSVPEKTPQGLTVIHATEPKAFLAANSFCVEPFLDVMLLKGYFIDASTAQDTTLMQVLNSIRPSNFQVSDSGDLVMIKSESVHYQSFLELANRFSIGWLKSYRERSIRSVIEGTLQERADKLNKQLKSLSKKQASLPDEMYYRMRADTLMANLHEDIEINGKLELNNVHDNQPISIRVNSKLSIQENAEAYYRKAKNCHLEKDVLKKRLISINKGLAEIAKLRANYEQLDHIKDLQEFAKNLGTSTEKKKTAVGLPYRSFEYKGFDIWVGKSASDNDELLKVCGKSDHWLHAREVAGSHVIIRNPGKAGIPEEVIEYAASLAAGYSKNKHESLSAVIHTPVKFVRKFKGAAPGQVRVEREKVVLVPPKKE